MSNPDQSTRSLTGALLVSKSASGVALARELRRLCIECAVTREADELPTTARPILLIESDSDTPDLAATKAAVAMGFSCLVIGDGASLEQRLASVRAGAAGFVPRPVEPMTLADEIERLAAPASEDPYRVLIVDDSAAMAAASAAVLERAGMLVTEETDPLAALDVIRRTSPDLVLLDIHMPGCTGMELAAIIRQHPDLVGLPIVFLSAETEVSRQLLAMSRGGDDFMVKPVPAQTLISSVTARIARARALKASLVRDGLTGLLNRKAFMHEIETILVLAGRGGWDVPVILLDVDH
ncbi:MAG: response regulator, partial [Alphaproteobacteria bacterium]|nr:response regulator [Alphaproteobacteria bacterium]